MRKIIVITLLLIISLTAFVFSESPLRRSESQAGPIKAEVDKSKITTDEVLTYKIMITSSLKKIPAPELPEFEGFYILSQFQSSNISFLKSKAQTTIGYTFILAPKQAGTFAIMPASIKIKDKTYSTDSFKIEVIPGKKRRKKDYEFEPDRSRKRHPKIEPEKKKPEITL